MKKNCLVLLVVVVSVFASLSLHAEEIEVHTFFKSVEHRWLGEQAKLPFPGQKIENAEVYRLHLPNKNTLTFGDVIALAGDFYGVSSNPISDGETFADRKQRFLDAFDVLAEEESMEMCDFDYCSNRLLDLFEEESKALREGDIERAMHKLSMSYVASVQHYSNGRYLALAIKNWDHFLPTSILAYEAGHAVATEQALKARQIKNASEQKVALELAYAMDAFANHFLTDMFSSGHTRVPRREIYEQSTFASVAGLIAKQMHDEDGRVGLHVHNARGDQWMMYGDGQLFAQGADTNRNLALFAVQTSIAEVYAAFEYGSVLNRDAYGVKKLIAQADQKNTSPLYVLVNGVVMARTQNDLCTFEWTDSWTGVGQLLNYASPEASGPCL